METVHVDASDPILKRLGLDRVALEALCRASGVRHLAVFGSAVRDDFDAERSDLDIVAALDAPSASTYADRYFMLKEGLERLTGRPVDLLTEPSITNPHLARHIAAERVTLYAA